MHGVEEMPLNAIEDIDKKVQSAHVFVFDFHFESLSKMEISKRKEALRRYFKKLRKELESEHADICTGVYLRTH